MRVGLDTNVLISGIFWKGPSEKLLARWIGDAFTVLVSRPILEEYEDVLHRREYHSYPVVAPSRDGIK